MDSWKPTPLSLSSGFGLHEFQDENSLPSSLMNSTPLWSPTNGHSAGDFGDAWTCPYAPCDQTYNKSYNQMDIQNHLESCMHHNTLFNAPPPPLVGRLHEEPRLTGKSRSIPIQKPSKSPDPELWICPSVSCGKSYPVTSTRSIRRHEQECKVLRAERGSPPRQKASLSSRAQTSSDMDTGGDSKAVPSTTSAPIVTSKPSNAMQTSSATMMEDSTPTLSPLQPLQPLQPQQPSLNLQQLIPQLQNQLQSHLQTLGGSQPTMHTTQSVGTVLSLNSSAAPMTTDRVVTVAPQGPMWRCICDTFFAPSNQKGIAQHLLACNVAQGASLAAAMTPPSLPSHTQTETKQGRHFHSLGTFTPQQGFSSIAHFDEVQRMQHAFTMLSAHMNAATMNGGSQSSCPFMPGSANGLKPMPTHKGNNNNNNSSSSSSNGIGTQSLSANNNRNSSFPSKSFMMDTSSDLKAALGVLQQSQQPSQSSSSTSFTQMLPPGLLALPSERKHIELVRRTWPAVLKDKNNGLKLYQRLYDIAPSMRAMFDGVDIVLQSHLFMDMFTKLIDVLGTPDATRMLKAAGRRHVRYGVQDSHFPVVRDALMWILEGSLDKGYTSDVKAAWLWVFSVAEQNMKAGARDAPSQ